MKKKSLPPTLREKNRYLALKVMSDRRLEKREVAKAVWKSALDFLGEIGVSETSVWLVDWDSGKNQGIVKTNRSSVDRIRASIILIRDVGGTPVIPYVRGVSGTIKSLREKYLANS